MNPLFEYMNFRDFLRDFYEHKRQEHSFYSYRLFSQKAGFSSPNFLKLVIDGKRNLSKESVFKCMRALNLTKPETDYFENLVFFNQSQTLDEKNAYLAKLLKHRKKSEPGRIEESEFEYYSAWYHPVIRELATAKDFRDDFRALGKMIIPAISGDEVQKSVQLLLKLGYIVRSEQGGYEKTSLSLSTGPQVRSVAVANYHKEMLRLASESIERIPAGRRDISSLTLSVSDETYAMLKEKIVAFRRELLSIAEAQPRADIVAQVNIQLFPLSQNFGEQGRGE